MVRLLTTEPFRWAIGLSALARAGIDEAKARYEAARTRG
jgi:hypothetical protein